MPKYEVQTRFYDTWKNVWTENDQPMYFDSYRSASIEIELFIRECKDEVSEGNLEDCPDITDFRIVEVE